MYYPLSQITTNLYTNGGEFTVFKTNQPYKGYYWKTSKGQYFTGKTPQDMPVEELTKDISNQIDTNTNELLTYVKYATNFDSVAYNTLQNIPQFLIQLPSYFITLPTQNDYQLGVFTRYFCKKTNEIIYLEISKNTYNKLIQKSSDMLWQLYQPFNISWQLTGNKEQVYTTNRNIVELTMKQQKLPQFDKYLKKDYVKYYQ